MLDEHSNLGLPGDRLLAAEFFDLLRKRIFAEPENRLMFAVLEDAVSCFQDNVLATDFKRKMIFADAERWILDAGSDELFSFDNLCAIFGITPQYLRRGLMRWKQEKLFTCCKQGEKTLGGKNSKVCEATRVSSLVHHVATHAVNHVLRSGRHSGKSLRVRHR